jgi:5-methylcytosine-specific restriction endonuclease McrA
MTRKSTGQYPANWKEIANTVKDEAGWMCVRCGHKHEPEIGYCLTVHHIDLNPANCEWWNLAALCQRCHLHIQSKVVIEQQYMFEHSNWFKPYVAGYYASVHGLSTDRGFVESNSERLLDYYGRPNKAIAPDG